MKTPLKTHGGKHYLAKQIVDLMPPRGLPDGYIHYCEPYFGGGSVLLANDPEGISEVVNDIDGNLMNFWRVLRDDELLTQLKELLEKTPVSKQIWELNKILLEVTGGYDSVTSAAALFTLCRQSLAGRRDSFTPLSKSRVRGGMNEQVNAWFGAIEGLPEVYDRIKRVVMYNEDATDVIRREASPYTLFYLDPTYLAETRTADQVYEYEMSVRQHEDLLSIIAADGESFYMISGYRSDLYDTRLKDWTRYDFKIANHASGSKKKRTMTECLWVNY